MMIRLSLNRAVILAAMVVFCGAASAVESSGESIYETLDGAQRTIVSKHSAATTSTLITPRAGQLKSLRERIEQRVGSCSTTDVKCVSIGDIVFAVPRGDLSIGRKYWAAGYVFNVLACSNGDPKRRESACSKLVIRGQCIKRSAESGECAQTADAQETSTSGGPIIFFQYDRRLGVLSFCDDFDATGSGSPISTVDAMGMCRYLIRGSGFLAK